MDEEDDMRECDAARRALVAIGLMATMVLGSGARAQMSLPAAQVLTGEELFKRQCSTCHTLNASDPQRQGPTLAGIFGRKVGSIEGFHYSPGFAKANWTWDAAHLDVWISNPQAMIPSAIMPYRQAKAEVRTAIIDYLKGLQ